MPFLAPDNVIYKKQGLTEKEVRKSVERYGDNTLSRKKSATFFSKYLESFGDPIIKILLVALALNIIIAIKNANIYEPLGIAVALFLATFVSTLSEYGSQSAFLKLEAQSRGVKVRVMRDGRLTEIDADGIVVGDTVFLCAGERVPADGVIVNGRVFVDTSPLNGESDEREHYKSAVTGDWDIHNKGLLLRGCTVTSGECEMVVGRVGDDTFYGGVAREIQLPSERSPLTKRLEKLAKSIGIIGYIAAAAVFFADLFNYFVIDGGIFNISSPHTVSALLRSLTLAITVVVVAVPEGLPMMITVVLSSNMQRLKRDNVLVRRLTGIETAGCINILFCDKTGTLTEGKLSVDAVYGADGKKCIPSDDMKIAMALTGGSITADKKATGGNATDRALLNYLKAIPDLKVVKKIPFDSEKKYAAVKTGGFWYVKGAPEVLFNKKFCTSLCNLHKSLTQDGMRVIALAKATDKDNVTPLGIVAIRDRLRRDVKKSVASVKAAGIHVCMITGDNLLSAECIARECGILEQNGVAIDSNRLMKMSDEEVKKMLPRLQVVARALPSDKSRLTRISKEMGLVCAMTGDGINDAPALKISDVGFAMGGGTEVAKEAGDIVILDNSFCSVANAVLYGRTIFKSIRKFIVFQLTINLVAVGVSVIGPFIGIDIPVTVMQMLWINMIMDTLAGLAFAGEAPDARYMREPPLTKAAPVLDKAMAVQTAFLVLHSLTVCVAFLYLNPFECDSRTFMSAFFALFVFQGIFAGVCARCPDALNIFRRLSKNRAFVIIFALISAVQILLLYFGGELFRAFPIPADVLTKTVALSSLILVTDLVRKILFKKFSKKDH